MQHTEVEVVLTNWKRKNNLPIIVESMRRQTVPVVVTLIDNAVEDTDAADPMVVDKVDKYFRIKHHPYGSSIRYACHGFYDSDFIYFSDDDIEPGRECVSHFLNHAQNRSEIGLLGQEGRIYFDNIYRFDGVHRRKSQFTSVDLCVRGYFVRRSVLSYLDEIKKRIVAAGFVKLFTQDDMMLASACRLAELEIALTPSDENPETKMCKTELPSPFAISSEPDRLQRRTEALRLFHTLKSSH